MNRSKKSLKSDELNKSPFELVRVKLSPVCKFHHPKMHPHEEADIHQGKEFKGPRTPMEANDPHTQCQLVGNKQVTHIAISIKTLARLATGEEHFELHNQDIQQPLGKYQQKIACSLSDVKHKMRKKKEKLKPKIDESQEKFRDFAKKQVL
ncbi:hypothetical protein H5410_017660 [Solanum commersonii]|uniref:Uncharacterized protein n=1 Tax=Solanum commersonii TaxID=4109 RepID=A0A9J6A0Z8_SOLCO|nr:hypothetical protein H5410_017660 [Solanum commersonii]